MPALGLGSLLGTILYHFSSFTLLPLGQSAEEEKSDFYLGKVQREKVSCTTRVTILPKRLCKMTKEAKNSLNLPGNIVWMAPLWLLRRRWLTEFCLLVIKHGNLSQGSWSLKGSELRNSHTNMWKPSCPFQSILRRQWCPMLTKDSRKKTISCWRFATTLARDKKGQWIRFSATLLIQFVLKDTDYFQNTTRCQSQ